MPTGVARKKGRNGDKKHGRNKLKCAAYSRERRYEKNRERRILKHLKKHPGDVTARAAVKAA